MEPFRRLGSQRGGRTSHDHDALARGAQEFLRLHLPPSSTRGLRPLGAGQDHLAYLVDETYVLRIAAEHGATAPVADGLAREQALLAYLGTRLPVAVPRPIAVAPDGGFALYTHVAGVSLLDEPAARPDDLPEILAATLNVLHGTALDDVEGLVPTDTTAPAEWQREALAHLERLGPLLTSAEESALRRLVGEAPPATEDLVLAHADLGAEHLIVGRSPARSVGIIDWSDASLTDPAIDFARLFRDLGPATLARIATAYEGRWDARVRARTHFYAVCALLEDMVHGYTTADSRYVEAARRHLGHVVAGPDAVRGRRH